MKILLLSCSFFISCLLHAQQKQFVRNIYRLVSEQYVDSIFTLTQIGNQYGESKYQIKNGNINETQSQKISFTAKCCDNLELYGGRVDLTDPIHKTIYSLTNKNIAGIDPKSKIGNDVSAIVTTVNGHQYDLPVVTYNKGQKFDDIVNTCIHKDKMVTIYCRLITAIRGQKVIPLLLVDDLALVK